MQKLSINLHEEDQVDYLLRTLAHLTTLNGIAVERDALFDSSDNHEEGEEEQEEMSDSAIQMQNYIVENKGSESNSINNSNIRLQQSRELKE